MKNDTTNYNEVFAKVANKMEELASGNKYVKQLIIEQKSSYICPYLQYVRIDALEKKDYPHGIDMNSVYLCFYVDYRDNKVELHSCGHVYLSDSDKQSEKYKYYVMKSIVNVHVDKGGKKFRKSKFKNETDLCKKMIDYFNVVMKDVNEYTGGYPYKA